MIINCRILDSNSAFELGDYLFMRSKSLSKGGFVRYIIYSHLIGTDFFDIQIETSGLSIDDKSFHRIKHHNINLHNIFNPSLYDTMFKQVEHDRQRSQ